ncbi:non-ribosomal peptide synthetase [Microbulbifer sp. VAAF005]|uniref:non-ribosomal peptide synthetase n=1 Tax=Microbulbifer sp. VAAF005 TaxID=3034230 RepID=UPI0024AE7001|nr:non-ribosomal peptide synthetase [Microbulbifer sp. VAAF005]WHI44694.1 amino acid adenylation domain-containing protein [Microbulbifer sp. VAAF005]
MNNKTHIKTDDFNLNSLWDNIFPYVKNRPAIYFKENTISYYELNNRICRLAKKLIDNGVSRESIVAVHCARGPDAVIALLAIIRIGAAYLPLEPALPLQRKEFILQDSNPALVVIDSHENSLFNLSGINEININDIYYPNQLEAINFKNCTYKNTLAYVIYTSGTTGKPKGVLIEHAGITNFLLTYKKIFSITPDDRIVQFAALSFDASISEILMALLNGACLYILPDEIRKDALLTQQYLKENQITIATLPPQFLSCIEPSLTELRTVIAAGSPSNWKTVNRWKPFVKYYNAYGPSEVSIGTTVSLVNTCEHMNGPVPIGTANDNLELFVLDKNGDLVNYGEVGELCIAGIGLARGYLNQEKLTNSKFIPASNSFPRYYKTGDLVRYRTDGQFEFIGRLDDQIKIRGHRVELKEIETVLQTFSTIKDAFVSAESRGDDTEIIAHIILHNQKEITSVKEEISSILPQYMLPQHIISVDKFPLTINGKVDASALPTPSISEFSGAFLLPTQNKGMSLFVDAISSILKIDKYKIPAEFSFTQLGGDSIKAIQVCSILAKYDHFLKTSDLMESLCLDDAIKKITLNFKRPLQETLSGELPLNPIQKWFFEHAIDGYNHFNQSGYINWHCTLDLDLVQKTLNYLYAYHDGLRTRFKLNQSKEWIASIGQPKAVSLESFDSGNINLLYEKATEIQSQFDIEKGALLHACLFNGKHLLISIHHLIIDMVSWRVLIDDFHSIYKSLEAGKQPSLPKKGHDVRLWIESLTQYVNSKEAAREVSYWENICQTETQSITRDNNDFVNTAGLSSLATLKVDIDTTSKLKGAANKAFNTKVNELLLASFSRTLAQWNGEGKYGISLEGHGREDFGKNLDVGRTVGWFTTFFPVILNSSLSTEVGTTIREIKEQIRSIPKNGFSYTALRYLSSPEIKSKLEMKRPIQIVFNYLGEFVEQDPLDRKGNLSLGMEFDRNYPRPDELEFNLYISNSILNIELRYPLEAFEEESINELLAIFYECIKSLVKTCVITKNTQFSPSDFQVAYLNLDEFDRLMADYPGTTNMYSLSPTLRTMLLDEKKGRLSGYHVQHEFELSGDFDTSRFYQALCYIVKKNESLRSIFTKVGSDKGIQLVLSNIEVEFESYDYRLYDKDTADQNIINLLQKDRKKGFQVDLVPPFRIYVCFIPHDKVRVIWSFHHIIMDGWCCDILWNQLKSAYFDSYTAINSIAPLQTFHDWVAKQDSESSIEYWRRALEGYESIASLPWSTPLINTGKDEILEEHIRISKREVYAITEIASSQHVTVSTILMSIWGLLLARYNQLKDILFLQVVSGRSSQVPDIDKMLGCFINTIPRRVNLNNNNLFKDLLKQYSQQVNESNSYDYLASTDILATQRISTNRFDHIVSIDNFNSGEPGGESPWNIERKKCIEGIAFPLTLDIQLGDTIDISVAYSSTSYSSESVKITLAHYIELLRYFIDNPNCHLDDIQLPSYQPGNLSGQQQLKVQDEDITPLLIDLIDDSMSRNANRTAILWKDKEVSYADLSYQTAVISNRLIALGITQDSLVGIHISRSPKQIAAILAVLYVGASFVPLDPFYPEEQLKIIIKSSDPDLIITNDHHLACKTLGNFSLLTLSTPGNTSIDLVNHRSQKSFRVSNSNRHPLMILFTSGSTGTAKGVKILNQGIVNHSRYFVDRLNIRNSDRILQFASINFDAAYEEIFPSLIAGACLVLRDSNIVESFESFHEQIYKQDITILDLPTAYFNQWSDYIFSNVVPDYYTEKLKSVVIGGEEALTDFVRKWILSMKNSISLFNTYGPTEATIISTLYEVPKVAPAENSVIPIGSEINNTVCYVLDSKLREVALGEVGELYISGLGVADGYVNDDAKTNTYFHLLPEKKSNNLFYRTGDIVRRNEFEELIFIGRNDNQVKLRGQRVNLDEIETCINSLSFVICSKVLIKQDKNGPSIVACIQANDSWTAKNLKSLLSTKLPDFLIPSKYIAVSTWPLSANGKLDSKKLLAKPYVIDKMVEEPPASSIEIQLAKIFEDALETKNISLDESFLSLGGHSLLAIKVVSMINQEMNCSIHIKDLLEAQSIRDLSRLLILGSYKDIDPLISLKDGENRSIFMVHPVGGHITCYLPLVDIFPKGISLYAFESIYQKQPVHKKLSVEEMAKIYAERLLATRNNQRIILAGWSMGGL